MADKTTPKSERLKKELGEILISRKSLAKRWDVSQKTIGRYERKGLFNPISLSSNIVRYRLSEIIAIEEDATAR